NTGHIIFALLRFLSKEYMLFAWPPFRFCEKDACARPKMSKMANMTTFFACINLKGTGFDGREEVVGDWWSCGSVKRTLCTAFCVAGRNNRLFQAIPRVFPPL